MAFLITRDNHVSMMKTKKMKTKTMGFVALVSIGIILSMTAVVGTLGVIAPIQNQATAQQQQQMGNQYFNARLTGSARVPLYKLML